MEERETLLDQREAQLDKSGSSETKIAEGRQELRAIENQLTMLQRLQGDLLNRQLQFEDTTMSGADSANLLDNLTQTITDLNSQVQQTEEATAKLATGLAKLQTQKDELTLEKDCLSMRKQTAEDLSKHPKKRSKLYEQEIQKVQVQLAATQKERNELERAAQSILKQERDMGVRNTEITEERVQVEKNIAVAQLKLQEAWSAKK